MRYTSSNRESTTCGFTLSGMAVALAALLTWTAAAAAPGLQVERVTEDVYAITGR